MEVKLTIQERLKDLRLEKGYTLEELSERTGLSRSALGSYEQDEGKDISHYAIIKLAKEYSVSADYLLGLTESRKMINAKLSQLHLNDKMITLLREQRINTRLLCELATHDDFPKLLSDIEIYIDGIASMRIRQMNQSIDMTRNELLNEHPDDLDSYQIRTLSAAMINEDELFLNRINCDMKHIVKDLKEIHKADPDTAVNDNVTQTVIKTLKEAVSTSGDNYDLFAQVFLELMKIDKETISDEEYSSFLSTISKSKLLERSRNMRGRKRPSSATYHKRKRNRR